VSINPFLQALSINCLSFPDYRWRIVSSDTEEDTSLTTTTTLPDKSKLTNNVKPTASSQNHQQLNNDEIEDISDEVMQAKHERALIEERKKFQSFLKFPFSSRSRANRRIDSRAESSGTNTPDQPPSPAAGIITPLNTTIDQESIPSPFASMPQTPLDGHELSESSVAQGRCS
jgi:KAT8 regulatory NSL complex subunit 1